MVQLADHKIVFCSYLQYLVSYPKGVLNSLPSVLALHALGCNGLGFPIKGFSNTQYYSVVIQANTHNKYSFIIYLYQLLLFIATYILTKEIPSADNAKFSRSAMITLFKMLWKTRMILPVKVRTTNCVTCVVIG